MVEADESVITLPIKIESPRDGHSCRVSLVSDSGLALELPPLDLSPSEASVVFSVPEEFSGVGFAQVILETDTGAHCQHSLFIK